MAAPKWWQIESIQAKRQREREVLDTVTRDVGGYLARGDVTGARRALADAAPNPNVPAAMKWERDLKSRLRQKFTPFQLHEPGTGPNDKDGGGGSLLGKVAKGAAAAATLANPLTSGAAVAGEVARRTGLMDKAEENAPKPVRTATSFGAALTSPLPTALNAVAGDKEARANVNRFISGERLGNDLGLPASEGLNKLREKGFVGRVAATAIDQATAPATYAGGVGIGQGFAQTGAKSVVAKSLARRWAQEVGAATVGTVAGEEAAKYAASKTDNPYVVGAAGIGAGLLAGSAAYNPKATAALSGRAGKAVGSAVAEDVRRVAADPAAAGRRLLADEAGQAQVIPRGTRIAHGSSTPLEGDLRASEYGSMGKGFYGDVNDPEVQLARYFALRAARDAQVQVPPDVLADSTKFENWVMAHPELQDAAAGANITPLTPLRDLNALRADMPVDKAELKAVRMALEPKQRAEFNRLVRDSAMDAEPLGGDVRFALKQMGDGTGEDFANAVLKKAGFDAMAGDNISKWGTSEVNVFDPNDLESWFAFAARQAADKSLGGKSIAGRIVGLPEGVNTVGDLQALQARIKQMAVDAAEHRHWYENSGGWMLRANGGDKAAATEMAIITAWGSTDTSVAAQGSFTARAMAQAQAGEAITKGHRYGAVSKQIDSLVNLYRSDRQEFARKVADMVAVGAKDAKAPKLGAFFTDLLDDIDPTLANYIRELSGVGATIDRWMARAYGFKTDVLSPAQRAFIQKDVDRIASELGWKPKQVQAAVWVNQLAKEKGISLSEAGLDYADSFAAHTAQISWETMPGEGTELYKLLDGVQDAPLPVQAELHAALTKVGLDENGTDILARAMHLPVAGQFEGPGVERFDGSLFIHPGSQTNVIVPGAARKSVPIVSPEVARQVSDYAALLALARSQRAAPWTRPFADAPKYAHNGMLLKLGEVIAPEDAAKLASYLDDDYAIVPHPEGALVFAIPGDVDYAARAVDGKVPKAAQDAAKALNASRQERVRYAVDNTFQERPVEGYTLATDGDYVTIERGQEVYDAIGREGSPAYLTPDVREAVDQLSRGTREVADGFAARYGFGPYRGTARPGFLSDAAGQVDTGLAANLATGAAGAAYGYATGDDTQDRWKRALAFGVGGLAGGAAVRVGVRAAFPGALPTTAPPRPASVLSALPPDAVENSYTTASGIQRIVPKVGTSGAARAVAAKQEALKVPGRVMEVLPPVVRNGVALLNPSVNQDQQVLVAWRAGQGVRAQLQTEWTAALNPIVERVETLLPTATYRGPRGTAADMLIGTAKDIADHPELYDISPELRSALDDLNVAMWDEVAGRARAEYGVDVHPYEGDGKPGFVYLPTLAAKDSLDDKLVNAFDSLSTKSMAKRRGYVSARERLVDPETGQTPESVKRSLAAGAKEFVPETDLRELVSAHIQAMASNAGHATMKEGAGGRTLGDVLDELHPGIAEAKTRTRQFVTNLNSRMKTAVSAKADTLKRISLNDTQMRQLEKRMQPLENRIAALEAENEFGPELSYLSGQVRELRMMRGKLATYAQTLEGRKNFNAAKIKTLDDAIDSAQAALEDVVRRYESAGTDPYVRDPLTQRWYTPEAAKTMTQLLARPAGFGKNLADISDEIRAWHLAGDASLGTIQGALGVMSDPISAAKTARKMLAGGNPQAELARLARDEADDVAEYTFATGRVFGDPLAEIRQQARGFERVPGIRTAQDQLSALFERGSYEAWKRERDIVLHENPGMSRSLAGHEAANMLSKVVPGLNPAERGVSGTRGAIERGALTSVSFATSPALLGAEAAKGTAKLAQQAALKLMRSTSVNPDGAWAALTAREQIALRRTVMLAGTVTALSTASAILSAPSRNLSVEEAVNEAFDPNSRYFAALQLGEGRSIPLGGPFRSAIKAIVPRDGVMFAGVPSWLGTRINSPIKPVIDIARNRDFQNDPIYQGNFARPENVARALWYFGGEGIAPVSAGQVSEDIRRGEFDPGGTSQRVIAQFLGSNLSPVSPTEKLSQISRAIYQKEFYDLLPSQREAIKKAQPKLWEEAVAAGSDARQQAEAQKAKLREAQQNDDDLFLQGKLTLEKWAQATDDRSNQLVGAEDVLFADAKGKASKPVSPVLEAYYQAIDASAKANNGRVDWDAIDVWKSGLSKADQKLIDENTGLNKTPLVKLKSDLQKQYYSLPRYRGYTADQAVAIDDLWQEVRNNARGSDDASMLAALRRNPQLTRGQDAKVVEGVKRRILGLLMEDSSRKNWAKAHPEAAVFLRRGKLTAADSVAIKKALGGSSR